MMQAASQAALGLQYTGQAVPAHGVPSPMQVPSPVHRPGAAAPMPRMARSPMAMPSAAAPRSGMPILAPAALHPGAMSATPLPSVRPSGHGLPGALPNFASPVSIATGGGVPGFGPSPTAPDLGADERNTLTDQHLTSDRADLSAYMSDLQRRIKKAWFPPRQQEGRKVVCIFKIARSGQLSDLRIVRYSLLNRTITGRGSG